VNLGKFDQKQKGIRKIDLGIILTFIIFALLRKFDVEYKIAKHFASNAIDID